MVACGIHPCLHEGPGGSSDKVYQLLAHCRWFSPGTPASSTTKTDRHDIAEILLKVALNTKNQIKIKSMSTQEVFRCLWVTTKITFRPVIAIIFLEMIFSISAGRLSE